MVTFAGFLAVVVGLLVTGAGVVGGVFQMLGRPMGATSADQPSRNLSHLPGSAYKADERPQGCPNLASVDHGRDSLGLLGMFHPVPSKASVRVTHVPGPGPERRDSVGLAEATSLV